MQALRAPTSRSLARRPAAPVASASSHVLPAPARRAGLAPQVFTAAPLAVPAPRQATVVRAAADPFEG